MLSQSCLRRKSGLAGNFLAKSEARSAFWAAGSSVDGERGNVRAAPGPPRDSSRRATPGRTPARRIRINTASDVRSLSTPSQRRAYTLISLVIHAYRKTAIMEGSHRLFRFPKPAWMNSANTRTAGVYIAGALVSFLPCYCCILRHSTNKKW